MPILCVSHALNAFRMIISSRTQNQVLRNPKRQFQLHLTEKLFDFCGSLFHLLALMIAQDWYFFTDLGETCTVQDFGLVHNWMLLEVFIFYASIFSTVIFMLISRMFLKNSGLMYLETEDTDFLNRYTTMNGFF